jgi:hypothetical protein
MCKNVQAERLPPDSIFILELAEVTGIGKREDDGTLIESAHSLHDVLGECILEQISFAKEGKCTVLTFKVLRPSRAVGLTWLIMSTKLVS